MVVSTTGAGHPIVTRDYYRTHIAPQRNQRPLFILDLALPRDFEPLVGKELGVYLYSIDDLASVCERNRKSRLRELPKAEAIIVEETDKFLVEVRHRATVPVIAKLRDEFDVVKQAEL